MGEKILKTEKEKKEDEIYKKELLKKKNNRVIFMIEKRIFFLDLLKKRFKGFFMNLKTFLKVFTVM